MLKNTVFILFQISVVFMLSCQVNNLWFAQMLFTFKYGKGKESYIPEFIKPEGNIVFSYKTNWMMPKNDRELESTIYRVARETLPLTVMAPDWVGISNDVRDKRDVIHLFNDNHTQNATGISLQYKGKIKKTMVVSPDENSVIKTLLSKMTVLQS